MSSADILRTPGLAQAIADGADALDQAVKDQATIAGLQTSLTAATGQLAATRPTSYTVQAGDTLAKIATQLGVPDWHSLVTWNGLTSTTIKPGQQLLAVVTSPTPEPTPTPEPVPTPTPTPTPSPTPTPPPAATTMFGMNLGSRTIADRLRQFGRVPKVKQFSLVDVSALPEKRAQVCVPWDQTKLANGDYDATIAAYLEKQVAAGARFVGVTNRQEPEDFLKVSQANVDVWKAATRRLAGLVKAHGKAGVTYTVPCLIAPHKETGMVVPDAWMLTPDDLGGQDWCVWSWDDYGNPFGAKNYSNDVYATPYPDGATIAAQAFPLLQKFGWTRWGVSEFNTPFRKDLAAPGDPKHLLRIKYLEDYVQACLHAPAQIGPPMWMDLWEEQGTRYDQTFTVQAEYDWWKGYVAKSA